MGKPTASASGVACFDGVGLGLSAEALLSSHGWGTEEHRGGDRAESVCSKWEQKPNPLNPSPVRYQRNKPSCKARVGDLGIWIPDGNCDCANMLRVYCLKPMPSHRLPPSLKWDLGYY